jgi:hypothetical protein
MDLGRIDSKIRSHVVAKEIRVNDKAVDGFGDRLDLLHALAAKRLRQAIQKYVVALQRDENGNAQFVFDRLNAATDQDTLVNTIRSGRSCFSQSTSRRTSLRWLPLASFQHRHGEGSQCPGVHFHRFRRHATDQSRAVEEMVHGRGQIAEKRDLLLEIDIQPSEQNMIHAHIGFIGPDGCVGRERAECPNHSGGHRLGERVVVHAAAAIHAGRAGGQVDDLWFRSHQSVLPNPVN